MLNPLKIFLKIGMKTCVSVIYVKMIFTKIFYTQYNLFSLLLFYIGHLLFTLGYLISDHPFFQKFSHSPDLIRTTPTPFATL